MLCCCFSTTPALAPVRRRGSLSPPSSSIHQATCVCSARASFSAGKPPRSHSMAMSSPDSSSPSSSQGSNHRESGVSFANLSSGSGREVDRGWIGNATGVIACERAHGGPEIASGRTRLRRSGRGLAIYVDVGMADVCEDLRRRGARSGDAGHPLRVALRSRPWSAAGRPLAPARPWPKIDEFWTCDSRQSRQSEFGGDGVH